MRKNPLIKTALALTAATLLALPAQAANVSHVTVTRPTPPVATTGRTPAGAMAARADARAGNATGNAYVNPNVTASPGVSPQNGGSAHANANAAEMRSAHVNTR